MNRDELAKLAQQVWSAGGVYIGPSLDSLEQFAELFFFAESEKLMDEMVEEANHAIEYAMQFEREECARLLEDYERFGDTRDCVAAILKRGQK
jgi:hypothetical protein